MAVFEAKVYGIRRRNTRAQCDSLAGRIKAGSVCDTTLNFVDMVPTICSITGISLPKDRTIDGVDFSPALFGESWSRDKPLLWYFYRSIAGAGQRALGITRQMPAGAFRKGDWVLLGYLRNETMPSTHAMVAPDMDFIGVPGTASSYTT